MRTQCPYGRARSARPDQYRSYARLSKGIWPATSTPCRMPNYSNRWRAGSRPAPAASDQDVADRPGRGTDEQGGKKRTTPGNGQEARDSAGFSALTAARESVHAPVCAGLEAARSRSRLQASIVSYADDFVICCKGDVDEALTEMREIMRRLKLTVNEAKTHVCHLPQERFDFLGYTFGRYYSPQTGQAYLCPARPSAVCSASSERSGRRPNEGHRGGRPTRWYVRLTASSSGGPTTSVWVRWESLSGDRRVHAAPALLVVMPKAQGAQLGGESLPVRVPLRTLGLVELIAVRTDLPRAMA